jgi:hypothetical protein
VRFQEWAKESFVQALKTPLLGPMFSGIVRLFNMQPTAVFKLAPLAWKAAYRNCGELDMTGNGSTDIRGALTGLPEILAKSRPYILGVAAILEGILDLTKTPGKVAIESQDVKKGLVKFIMLK